LTVLPRSKTKDEVKDVRLLLFPKLFQVFVGSILSNPVRVEDSQTTNLSSDSFFSDGLKVSGELELNNTLVGWLSANNTLSDWLFTASSSDSNSVDHVTLLVLVSQSTGLVRSGGS